MTQELGRISRPEAAQYEGRRKLLLAPLVYGPPAEAGEGVNILQNYWDQMQQQVEALQGALGGLHHIYHESVWDGGDDGLEQLEQTDQRSHQFVKAKCEGGATLEATEDLPSLMESLDLQRCLMMPLASQTVPAKLQGWLSESARSRYQHIASRIDGTLGENEVGLLLVNERHQIQFPEDIEVFYVAPPALGDFRRWLDNWMAEQQKAVDGQLEDEQQEQDAGEGEGAEEEQAAS